MPSTNTVTMTEKDILADSLSFQKYVTSNYNMFAGECVNPQLRTELLSILKEEHDIQNEIFCEMHSRGWYEVKPAQMQEIDCLRQKFPVSR